MKLCFLAAFLAVWWLSSPARADERRLLVAFEASAAELPQEQIRQAIAAELAGTASVEPGGSEARTAAAPADRLAIALDAQGLWLKYQGPRGFVERHLPLPESAEQVPVVVSLALGNLVREEAFELQRELERRPSEAELAKRRAFAAESRPKPRRVPMPPTRARWWSQSLAYSVTAAAAEHHAFRAPCSAHGASLGWKCYVGASPYQPAEQVGDATAIRDQTRLTKLSWSVSYTVLLADHYGFSVRAGLGVLGGGPVPWFAELRLRHGLFNVSWLGNAIRPFWYTGIGVGHSETRLAVEGADRQGVEAVREYGPVFLTIGPGLRAKLSQRWHLEAEWGLVTHLETKGSLLQSGLSVSYDF